jgi:hypothetical protein
MTYLSQIQRCNRRDVRRYVPFVAGSTQVGWLTPERAAALKKLRGVFVSEGKGVAFKPSLKTATQRSRAIEDVLLDLTTTGLFSRLRGEIYAVKNVWSDKPFFNIDRGLMANFGLRAYGVHMNGIVRKPSGLHLWIGTRSKDMRVAPGKLDNIVAGGQPAGLSLMANLVKECGEEAHMPPKLARTAKCVSSLSYAFDVREGLRADTLFCYDLILPAGFKPKVSEEITRYQLMPIQEALRLARTTQSFKFNVSLVIIDCAIRHGLIAPDTTPDFDAIVSGLHERPQPIV